MKLSLITFKFELTAAGSRGINGNLPEYLQADGRIQIAPGYLYAS
jgi:hypothetical protein